MKPVKYEKKRVKSVKTNLSELPFSSEEYPNLAPVKEPSIDFYEPVVFENPVFLSTDPVFTGVKAEEIAEERNNRDKRALEKKLGMHIVKDSVHRLVRIFQENKIVDPVIKQYIS